jgi:hypothetical protein
MAVAILTGNLPAQAADSFSLRGTNASARVVIVENPRATFEFQPDEAVVQAMMNRGLMNFTGTNTATAAASSPCRTSSASKFIQMPEP